MRKVGLAPLRSISKMRFKTIREPTKILETRVEKGNRSYQGRF